MKKSSIHALAGIRIPANNPNHHLWNNHGVWFLHYTVHPTAYTKERVRRSLATRDVKVARARRDAFFAHIHDQSAKALNQLVMRRAVAA